MGVESQRTVLMEVVLKKKIRGKGKKVLVGFSQRVEEESWDGGEGKIYFAMLPNYYCG